MRIAPAALALLLLAATAAAQEPKVTTISSTTHVSYVRPKFLPPQELAETMGARFEGTRGLIEWRDEAGAHVHRQVAGLAQRWKHAELETGVQRVGDEQVGEAGVARDVGDALAVEDAGAPVVEGEDVRRVADRGGAGFLEHAQVAAEVDAGVRIGFPSREWSRGRREVELVPEPMDAGLKLSVLPSLGEAGYLTMNVRAELTRLASNISGSPVKDGQMVENTVIVKDGEPVLLGGFERTTESRLTRRVPVLGYILPFLFSRHETVRSTTHNFVVLTPHVVDLAPALDERTRKELGR